MKMQPDASRSQLVNTRGNRSEAGSAYLVVLLVMLVLVAIGLSLGLTSQMETLKGSNQKTIERLLYSADSGLSVSVMRMLVTGGYKPFSFRVKDKDTTISLASRISVSPIVPISQTPCHLCQINQGSDYFKINHVVTSTATREGWREGSDPETHATPLGRKTVSSSVRMQPWRSTPAAHDFTDEELASLRM